MSKTYSYDFSAENDMFFGIVFIVVLLGRKYAFSTMHFCPFWRVWIRNKAFLSYSRFFLNLPEIILFFPNPTRRNYPKLNKVLVFLDSFCDGGRRRGWEAWDREGLKWLFIMLNLEIFCPPQGIVEMTPLCGVSVASERCAFYMHHALWMNFYIIFIHLHARIDLFHIGIDV